MMLDMNYSKSINFLIEFADTGTDRLSVLMNDSLVHFRDLELFCEVAVVLHAGKPDDIAELVLTP